MDQNKLILIFGRDGQVGKALQKYLVNLQSPAVFLGRSDCDLSCEQSIENALNFYRPQIIINAAAFTAVDNAENECKLAFFINARAPELFAQYISKVNCGIFVHFSTDYVFADTKQDSYSETDSPGPIDQLNIYGQSKLAGEEAIKAVFHQFYESNISTYTDGFPRYYILRTSWVYGDGVNFIRTMLRLASKHDQLRVVVDQVGVPTSAKWLAEMSIKFIKSKVNSGIYHVVPDGETTWYGLALYAIEKAANFGAKFFVSHNNILPIPANEYPVAAKRPYNSRLNNAKLKKTLFEAGHIDRYPNWEDQVKEYVKDFLSSK